MYFFSFTLGFALKSCLYFCGKLNNCKTLPAFKHTATQTEQPLKQISKSCSGSPKFLVDFSSFPMWLSDFLTGISKNVFKLEMGMYFDVQDKNCRLTGCCHVNVCCMTGFQIFPYLQNLFIAFCYQCKFYYIQHQDLIIAQPCEGPNETCKTQKHSKWALFCYFQVEKKLSTHINSVNHTKLDIAV